MLVNEQNQIIPYIHIIFVHPDEYLEYRNIWSHHLAIVRLPSDLPDIQETVDTGGIGFSRRFMQLFAQEMKIGIFYMLDDNIWYLKVS